MNHKSSAGVVAIGNFDGVHKGHAALLARARVLADIHKLPLTVLTFEPHPRTFFKPEAPPFRLTPESVKARRLDALRVDRVDEMPFDASLAGLDAKDFIDQIIIELLDTKHVVVGADFHFGKDRGGHVDTLQADKRFTTHAIALENIGEAPASSTRIREALTVGDIAGANAMLGWEWEIESLVERGDGRGKVLGYPTANMMFNDTLAPAYGIYAVRAYINGMWRPGVANIGVRPMFKVKLPLLEAHLFDFDGDLYGQTLRVRPVKKLRDEAAFENHGALIAQMDRDSAAARAVL